MKLDSLSTPEGERRIFIYSAAWAKQQEKDNYQTTKNGNGKQWKQDQKIQTHGLHPKILFQQSMLQPTRSLFFCFESRLVT
jgi:hypothetical protein